MFFGVAFPLLYFGCRGFKEAVFGRDSCLPGWLACELWAQVNTWLTDVGLALSNSDDCSYHSTLVLKYGMARGVCGTVAWDNDK